MTSRPAALLAGALAVPLLLTGCGAATSAAASSLEEDNARAQKALREATSVAVGLELSDPDGDLRKALTSGADAMSAEQADVLLGAGLSFVVAAADGKRLAELGDPAAPAAEQVDAADVAIRVEAGDGRLAELRLVDGVLYAGAEEAGVERVLSAFEGPDLDALAADVPPDLASLVTDLRAGKWLKLSVGEYVDDLQELSGQGASPAPDGAALQQLAADLSAAVTPAVKLSELGTDGGTRTVSVEVQVDKALAAVGGVLDASSADLGLPEALGLQDLSSEVSSDPVTAKLTIEDGHYTRLELPLQELADLDPTPDADVPALGSSALVLTLDDSAGEVEAPTDLSGFDLDQLVEGLLGSFLGSGLGEGDGPECLVDPTLC